jgi:hypothetical protein
MSEQHAPPGPPRADAPRRPVGPLAQVGSFLAGRGAVFFVAVAVGALVLAGLLGYVTVRDTLGSRASAESDARSSAPRAAAAPAPATDRVVHRRGGFAVAVPQRMRVTREGRTLRLATRDRSLVVDVGPAPGGRLPAAHRSFLGDVQASYRKVRILGTERTRVDGRAAISSAGLGHNSSGVRLRFVVLTVAARPHGYTIAAYTGRDSDPARTLPLVNAVANGFEVLPRR